MFWCVPEESAVGREVDNTEHAGQESDTETALRAQEEEIAACQWMDADEFLQKQKGLMPEGSV